MRTAMSDHIHYYFRVKFHECDPQGVVFNARYCEYASVAAREFMRAIRRPEGPSCALVKQVIEWKAPARFDEVLRARVRPQHIGESSFALAIEFRNADSDAAIASAESTYVYFGRVSGKSHALPQPLREGVLRGGGGTCIDHAAYLAAKAQACATAH